MTVDNASILDAARELIGRYGRNALAVARERVDAFSKQRNQPEMDIALRVLTEVETLLGPIEATTSAANAANDTAGPEGPAALDVGSADRPA